MGETFLGGDAETLGKGPGYREGNEASQDRDVDRDSQEEHATRAADNSAMWGVAVAVALICANVAAFLYGQYQTLEPILFPIGLLGASIVTIWFSWKTEPRDFAVLVVVTTCVAFVDEYAHTSSGIFTYFDGYSPSPLTVSGWGLFVTTILAIALFLRRRITLWAEPRWLGLIPALVSITLIPILIAGLGYLPVMGILLVLVYGGMSIASLHYSYNHPPSWNLSLVVTSAVFGASMEYVGSMEGLWSFHFAEPICVFMIFTWSLRVLTVLAICQIAGAKFGDRTR